MSETSPPSDRRLRALAPPAIAWGPVVPGTRLPPLLSRLAPEEAAWTLRLDGPADQVRYLLELVATEGLEAHAAPTGRGAELILPAAHPLVSSLLSASEAPDCTVVVLAGERAAVAVTGGRERRALLGAGGGPGPAETAAGRRRAVLPAVAAAVLLAAAAAWAAAPPRTGPDPRLQVGPAPPAREQLAAAIDGRRRELVLFGGIAAGAPEVDLGDTWTRSAGSWQLRRPATSPPPRFGAVMADDPRSGRVVLFGGRRRAPPEVLEDTWDWDGVTWRRRHETATPPPGAVARGLAYDAAQRTLVLVTDGPGEARTWTWSGGGWSAHPGATTPAMLWMAAAPDGAVIAVGPPDAVNRGTTWRWDGSRWERRAPATDVRVEPLSAVVVYDPATRRTLVVEVEFAGADGAQAGGTWTWDGDTWTEHHSAPDVVGAFGVTQPVVAADRPLVLVGGPPTAAAYRDAWFWDGSAWRRS